MAPISVALCHCEDYSSASLAHKIPLLLEKAHFVVPCGTKVVLKPNLLMQRPLACTSPGVVAEVARWFIDQGADLIVGDSPGFGSAMGIAKRIGLADALRPLGLGVRNFSRGADVALFVQGKRIVVNISRECAESDLVISVGRVKAHAMVRITLGVKNCFGCVPGLRKAVIHSLYGGDRSFFCELLVQLWRALPAVYGVLDGITAMHVTGPARGEPYPLHLLGASKDAAALDLAVLTAIGIHPATVPLMPACENFDPSDMHFPLECPADFSAPGFVVPAVLSSTSFAPLRLVKSCVRRMWARLGN